MTLSTNTDWLLFDDSERGPAPKVQQQLERITRPKTQQRIVMQMLETVLAQQNR